MVYYLLRIFIGVQEFDWGFTPEQWLTTAHKFRRLVQVVVQIK